ncbi:MAG: DUF4292 domain-containing protein [Flavipsychrobacter sp.]|nr:DUF4292 domain-containing protein [Flavipsychrobacter sp.]
MNKFVIAFLLVASSGVFSGCIFGKKAHSTATVSPHADSSTVTIRKSDTGIIAQHIDTLKNTGVVRRDTSTQINHADTAAANTVANKINTQAIANATSIWHRPVAYNTFDGKAKMHYEGNGSGQEFTANFRIKKDSVIWVAVSALGGMISVARAYITPDSIKVINYISKEVILMPINQANRLLPAPVDFSILQNLITGQALLGDGTVTNVADSSMAWILSIADNSYNQQLTYTKADSTLPAQQMATSAPNGPKVSIQQTSYLRQEGIPFARSRTVHIDNNGALYEMTMDFTSQSFNKLLDFPFSYSSKYAVNPAK